MDSFESAFRKEKAYLKELAVKIAEQNPALADFIGIQAADPDVERLLEAFSLLTAGLRQKVEDAFPEITENVLSRIWPLLLYPVPGSSMIHFSPKDRAFTDKIRVRQGAQLFAHKEFAHKESVHKEEENIAFRLGRSVTIEPLTLVKKQINKTNNKTLFELTFYYHGSQQNYLPDVLTLFLGNITQTAAELRLWFEQYLEKAWLVRGHEVVSIDESLISTLTPSPEQLLLPVEKNEFWPFQLLYEYFYLPHIHDFITVDFPRLLRGVVFRPGEYFTLRFQFDGLLPLSQEDIEQSFILNCAPVINLEDSVSPPVAFQKEQHSYAIPQLENEGIFAIHAVTVAAEPEDRARGEKKQFYPIREYYSGAHFRPNQQNEYYYETVIEQTAIGRRLHRIRFYNSEAAPLLRTGHRFFICHYSRFNLDSDSLAVGAITERGIAIPSELSVTNITPVTPALPAVTNSQQHWHLLGNLSQAPFLLNNLNAVKEMLQSLNLHASLNQPQARRIQQYINGIAGVKAWPVDKLIQGQPIRGMQFEMTLDETCYPSRGEMYVFASVLAYFFPFSLTQNSFLLTDVIVQQTGEKWFLPQVSGTRKLL